MLIAASRANLPLFPDNLDHHIECWNCGSEALPAYTGVFRCGCGCSWRNYSPDDAERNRVIRRSQEGLASIKFEVEFVDFTKPGALSSPA